MLWPLVILVALMIPLTAIVLDSPVVRAWVERRHGAGAPLSQHELEDLAKKVGVLETDLETVTRQLAQLQEEHQFLQRLLEDPTRRQAATKAVTDSTGG
jgi:uncharacterized protein YpuA (DUF1002 family)